MATRFGISDAVGQIVVDSGVCGKPFFGRLTASLYPTLGSETKKTADDKVNKLVAVAYARARTCLVENRNLLDKLAQMLVEQEVVPFDDFYRNPLPR